MTKDKIEKHTKIAENQQITRRLTNQEAEKIIKEGLTTKSSPKMIIQEMTGEISDNQGNIEGFKPAPDSATCKYMLMKNFDNHLLLSYSCDEEYRPLVIQFADELIQEYDCKTSSEKALAQVVVNAYYRILKCSRTLNNRICPEYISHEKASYLGITSKELDKANRQFINALQALKQIKQPQISMNVKANTAYLSQNQQINNITDPTNPIPNKNSDEIIEQQ